MMRPTRSAALHSANLRSATLRFGLASVLVLSALSCASGKKWVKEPFQAGDQSEGIRLMDGSTGGGSGESTGTSVERSQINAPPDAPTDQEWADSQGERPELKLKGSKQTTHNRPVDGELIGVFRNTYYDFPAESAFSGEKVALMNRACKPISQVPRTFYEAVCVQGSGTLVSGGTVSFAKRDCGCAELCPRTNQKICFDELSQSKFPWGRGAQGTAITPLRSVAVDSDVIPLGTRLYIPEYDGVPRQEGGARHDGCFIAEDRGMKVKGEHVDIFTGNPSSTAHFNQQVPSNAGVHVYEGTARCEAQ